MRAIQSGMHDQTTVRAAGNQAESPAQMLKLAKGLQGNEAKR